MSDKMFTTGEVAKFTGVNFRTVIRWIERGELAGYKLPGRGDHRVTLESLLAFLKLHEIPIPEKLQCLDSDLEANKVLVVDDDIAMVNAISRVLRRAGWQVEVAHDGFEAGIKLNDFKPSLMILDLKMPFLDGFKVLELTRQIYSKEKMMIVVISAGSGETLTSALNLGADAVLEKPFNNEQLMQVIS